MSRPLAEEMDEKENVYLKLVLESLYSVHYSYLQLVYLI